MMTASVAMGVAVDDAAHLIAWFRLGIGQGLDRRNAVLYALRNASLAMTQSSVIVGFALAVFGFSSFVPTQRFGIQMLVLLAFGLFADLVLMPAILAGPAGRFFTKAVPRTSED
jgi:predicted RND superfamily exporter protein